MKKLQQENSNLRSDVKSIINGVNKIVVGMQEITELIILCMICNDHLLLEDVPGTGKTMLVNTMARILKLNFRRVQGTPDLLPSDLTGVNIYDQKKNEFRFIGGPIFTNLLLFDEINRAAPKAHSALLEAMQERQVSIDNDIHKLDEFFWVIATQNPIDSVGTYYLPMAQIDRFLFKARVGYPNHEEEKKILLMKDSDIENVKLPSLSREEIAKWQNEFELTHIEDDLLEKIMGVIEKTRDHSIWELGISPRAGRKFIRAMKASAYIHDRDYVNRDDVVKLLPYVFGHRIIAINEDEKDEKIKDLIKEAEF
ncbi:AAA family ATPase [Candidatus Dojkabacteria bacterium]|nr:AAA family ATPase [Candidatus Dojkabacteria bacterium]